MGTRADVVAGDVPRQLHPSAVAPKAALPAHWRAHFSSAIAPDHVALALTLASADVAKQPTSSSSQLGAAHSAVLVCWTRTLTTDALAGALR